MDGARKIELGCGEGPQHIDDPAWVHADCRPLPHVEYVGDLSKKTVFEDNEFEEILARSILEHIPYIRVYDVLTEWKRFLSPGGKMELIVPQIDAAFKCYSNSTMSLAEFWGYIYGGQTYPGNFHLCGFTKDILYRLLTEVGFVDIKFTNPFKYEQELEPDSWEMRVVCYKPLTTEVK